VPPADVHRLKAASHAYGKRHSMKFTVRKQDNGYRCWRIS